MRDFYIFISFLALYGFLVPGIWYLAFAIQDWIEKKKENDQ